MRAVLTTALVGVSCIFSSSAMALVAAPGPEIGDGVAGGAAAALALLAIMILPGLKASRHSKD